jgi:Leucine-rich repeat (LRR) protein
MTDEQASKFAIEAFKNQALKVVKETFKIIDQNLQILSQKQEYALVYDLWKRKNYTSLTIEELKNIKSLDLGYTEIVDLPFEFMYLESLESLNLSGNNLQKVPE